VRGRGRIGLRGDGAEATRDLLPGVGIVSLTT